MPIAWAFFISIFTFITPTISTVADYTTNEWCSCFLPSSAATILWTRSSTITHPTTVARAFTVVLAFVMQRISPPFHLQQYDVIFVPRLNVADPMTAHRCTPHMSTQLTQPVKISFISIGYAEILCWNCHSCTCHTLVWFNTAMCDRGNHRQKLYGQVPFSASLLQAFVASIFLAKGILVPLLWSLSVTRFEHCTDEIDGIL